MAVEIRELVIKATVANTPQPPESTKDGTGGDRETLIQECVEQVLMLLKERDER